jgi:hypothetical protein
VARAGGVISQPVAIGDYLYVPAGAGIDVWNLADPAHPAHVGRTAVGHEAPGPILDLGAAADHLYANWTGFPNGVTIFSLADPTHPSLVGEIDGETPTFVARNPTAAPVYVERAAPNAFIAISAGTYSYSRNDVASGLGHSHHARPARPSFEP